MAINLVKGQTIDLRKNADGELFDLSSVTIGLGRDVREKSGGGLLSKLFGGSKEQEYDFTQILHRF
jgi:tellurium resistance protein TerD